MSRLLRLFACFLLLGILLQSNYLVTPVRSVLLHQRAEINSAASLSLKNVKTPSFERDDFDADEDFATTAEDEALVGDLAEESAGITDSSNQGDSALSSSMSMRNNIGRKKGRFSSIEIKQQADNAVDVSSNYEDLGDDNVDTGTDEEGADDKFEDSEHDEGNSDYHDFDSTDYSNDDDGANEYEAEHGNNFSESKNIPENVNVEVSHHSDVSLKEKSGSLAQSTSHDVADENSLPAASALQLENFGDSQLMNEQLDSFLEDLAELTVTQLGKILKDKKNLSEGSFLSMTSEEKFFRNLKEKLVTAVKGPIKSVCTNFMQGFLPHIETWVAKGLKPPTISRGAYSTLFKPLATAIFNKIEAELKVDVPDEIFELGNP